MKQSLRRAWGIALGGLTSFSVAVLIGICTDQVGSWLWQWLVPTFEWLYGTSQQTLVTSTIRVVAFCDGNIALALGYCIWYSSPKLGCRKWMALWLAGSSARALLVAVTYNSAIYTTKLVYMDAVIDLPMTYALVMIASSCIEHKRTLLRVQSVASAVAVLLAMMFAAMGRQAFELGLTNIIVWFAFGSGVAMGLAHGGKLSWGYLCLWALYVTGKVLEPWVLDGAAAQTVLILEVLLMAKWFPIVGLALACGGTLHQQPVRITAKAELCHGCSQLGRAVQPNNDP